MLIYKRKTEQQVEYEVYGSAGPQMLNNPVFKSHGAVSEQVYEQVDDIAPRHRQTAASTPVWYRPSLSRTQLDREMMKDPAARAFVTNSATDPVYDNMLLAMPKPAPKTSSVNKTRTISTDGPPLPAKGGAQRVSEMSTYEAMQAAPGEDIYEYSGSSRAGIMNGAYQLAPSSRSGVDNPSYEA